MSAGIPTILLPAPFSSTDPPSSDPFIHMERQNKTYGFTIAVKELKETVPNIFRYASAYKRVNNISSQGLWEMFLEPKPEEAKDELPKDDPKYKKPLPEDILRSEPGAGTLPEVDPEAMEGEVYNMCHFWSNFEIARLDWFRSKEYEDFFQMMDRSGGFWMERVSADCTDSESKFGAKLMRCSGVMLPFIPWPPVPCFRQHRFTTSVTSATDTRPSHIVPQMHPQGKCHGHHSSSRRLQTRRSAL